jgi:hypothetical protein
LDAFPDNFPTAQEKFGGNCGIRYSNMLTILDPNRSDAVAVSGHGGEPSEVREQRKMRVIKAGPDRDKRGRPR